MSEPEESIAEIATGRVSSLALAKDRQFVSVKYRVGIWDISNPSAQVALIIGSSGRVAITPLYQPILLEVSDIVCDYDGPSTATITIAADRPVGIYYTAGATWTRYSNLHDAIAANPGLCVGARCSVYADLVGDNDATATSYNLFIGTIRGLGSVTAGSITFVAEMVDVFELTMCPSATINAVPASLTGATLLPESLGLSVPVNLGGFRGTIAGYGEFVHSAGAWHLHNCGAFGLMLPTAPAAPWFSATIDNVVVSGFIPTQQGRRLYPGSTFGYYIDTGSTKARLYTGWFADDTYYSGAEGVTTDDDTDAQPRFSVSRFPLVQVPVSCDPVSMLDAALYTPLDELRKATDGNPNTYATIGPGKTAIFEIMSSGAVGRICNNFSDAGTTEWDYDGDGVPVGLKVLVLLVNDTGGDEPSGAESFDVKFTFPNGTVAFLAEDSFVPPSTSDNAFTLPIKVCQVNLRTATAVDPGLYGAGWVGSKFSSWDFTTEATADPDRTLSQGDNQSKPFRIRITNNESIASVRVSSVVFLVGCRYGIEAGAPYIRFYDKDSPHDVDRRTGWVGRKYGYSIVRNDSRRDAARSTVGAAVDALVHPTFEGARKADPTAPDPNPYRVSCSRPAYWDEADGRCSGISNLQLTDPVHHMMWLLVKGGVALADIETRDGYIGSVYNVRQMLSKFWRGGNTDTVGWPMDFSLLDPNPLGDRLAEIGTHCMGLHCLRMPNGKYGFFIWAPMNLMGDTYNAYASGASGERTNGAPERSISIGRQILDREIGAAIELWPSPYTEVVNDIEIKYGTGSYGLAKCNETVSDDGTGAPWGYGGFAPFSGGLTSVEIAAWSQSVYGKRNPLRLNVPGVTLPQVAAQIGLYYLLRGYRQTINWRATGNLGLVDVWPGHVARFDNDLQAVANFRFPFDDSVAQLWSDKSFLVTRSEHRTDGGSRQGIGGIVLPTWFRLEMCSGGDADQTPWEPPPEEPGVVVTVGGPAEGYIDREDETYPVPG